MPVGESEEDDAGEIGELGEEILRNDMNDLPIERPKCLSNINIAGTSSSVQQVQQYISDNIQGLVNHVGQTPKPISTSKSSGGINLLSAEGTEQHKRQMQRPNTSGFGVSKVS